MSVTATIGNITVGRMAGLLVERCGIKPGRIEPADRQQDFEGHIAAGRLDEPIAMEPVVEPGFDRRDLLPGDKIDLVEDEHVGERHLAKLQFHHLRRCEYLLRIHDTHDAVQPDVVPHGVIHERHRNAGRIGDAAGLEQDVFGPLGTRHYLRHRGNEIVADAAAHTAVGD